MFELLCSCDMLPFRHSLHACSMLLQPGYDTGNTEDSLKVSDMSVHPTQLLWVAAGVTLYEAQW